MYSLRSFRSYLIYTSKSLIEKRCPLVDCDYCVVGRLLSTDIQHLDSTLSTKNEENQTSEADTFGTLSPKTEDHLRKWTKKIELSKANLLEHRSKVSTPKGNKDNDTFGLLEPADQSTDGEKFHKGDELDEVLERRRRPVRWRTASSYGTEMNKLVKENKLRDALLLYKKMLEVDMVKPNDYVYNVLINGCGKYGFTSMAFKLFKAMRERAIPADNVTWTGLFNSCGNCPFIEYGLKSAHSLYRTVTEKGYALNDKNYHSAIKAFGRCGDMEMALKLVDEMIQKRIVVSVETFSFLLMGCASDKKSGLLHAIMIWRKMLEKRIRPNVFTYNLLLRVTRDCGVGEIKLAEQLLLSNKDTEFRRTGNINYLEAKSKPILESTAPISSVQLQTELPNILSPHCQPGSVTKLLPVTTPQDRLALLGSLTGFLARMAQDRAKPDLRTFTQLLEVIPSDRAVEERLLNEMQNLKIKCDVDFYNVLIKKRNCRQDLKAATDVLTLIARDRLYPDIATFGTLAIGCNTLPMAWKLLQDIESAGFRPNIEIMGAFISNACTRKDYWYIIEMLKVMRKHLIKPNPRLIDNLEDCVKTTKAMILEREKKGTRYAADDPFIKSFEAFLVFYKSWLKRNEMELNENPWSAYRPPENIDEILESENNKVL
ncbi:hypothetical protein CHUAL_011903 [Chamberlinius hualienensis]